ncbi:MAG: helicase HerA-like domain-containing protein [Candidatus Hydrogenedentota bacterium]
MTDKIAIGRADGRDISLLASMGNRHGLIAGATGTGKTVTLQTIAEGFSRIGVPVFAADVKGDLAGLAASGSSTEKLQERLQKLQLADHPFEAATVEMWDFHAASGIPLRTSVTEMGPLLLSRILFCTEPQASVLEIVFRIADDKGLALLDLKDLGAMLGWIADHRDELTREYGAITAQVLNVIRRKLATLSDAGGDQFFGEPSLALADLMRLDACGRGMINVLDASRVLQDPRIYTSFLLWLLSELFEQLDEVGDLDKPRLVFFFDEAHLLFEDAPKGLEERIQRVVRLIRSKGVSIFFVTQNPADLPEKVLSQLGHRIQHGLRAYTPKERKALRAAARGFRENPAFDAEQVLQELSTGEALVSVLDENGAPGIVERVLVAPPRSRIGPLLAEERAALLVRSTLRAKYEHPVDRESAYEMLRGRADVAEPTREEEQSLLHFLQGTDRSSRPVASEPVRSGKQRDDVRDAFLKSAARSIGSSVGRGIVRGVLGSIFGRRR